VNRVKGYRVFGTWLRSWVSFIVAFLALVLVYVLCWAAIQKWAPSATEYFRWGAIGAGVIGAIMLIFNELIVKWSMKAYRIRYREQCPKLWDAVVRACPAHFRPRPRIYMIPSGEMNAIAFGWGIRFMSAVGATEGIVERLSDQELTAVMAHEVGHILNKDILVSMMMMYAVMTMSFTGWMIWRFGPWKAGNSRRSSSNSKGSGGAALLVILLVGGTLYLLGRILGVILQMFVSRQREYAADARSARRMGTSRPLITALQKISGRAQIAGPIAGTAFGGLCTEDPYPNDMFSTHPAMPKRINALHDLEG